MKRTIAIFAVSVSVFLVTLSAQDATTYPVVKAGEIAKNPDQYYGKRVSVTAEVERLYSPQVFTLDEDKLFAGPDLLVIAPRATTVKDDTRVVVTGTLRKFVRAEIERDFNWFGRGAELEADVQKRAVLIADSIKTADGAELMPAAAKTNTTAAPAATKEP